MSDLVAFLRARLDEDEQAARAASEEDWTYEYGEFQSRGGEDFEHILRHGPARVLREVEAKRKLIEAHVDYYGPEDDKSWPVPTLTLLALPYADHPDYHEEWRP